MGKSAARIEDRMRLRWVGAAVVFSLAGGLIAWREWHRPLAPSVTPLPPPSAAAVRVVLFADLSEADEAGGCGAIIESVREAAKRGIATEEIDARSTSARAAHYHLLVAPAVLLLDTEGREVRRFEGESATTVRAIVKEMKALEPPR